VVVRIRNALIVESHSYLSEEELLDELGLLGGHPPQPDPCGSVSLDEPRH
jgi:hypothetical protein